MAIEALRGCGYRKVGGLYLVCPPMGEVCDWLPLPLTVCPTCGNGIKQSRGWTWVNLPALIAAWSDVGVHEGCKDSFPCPLCMRPDVIGRAGLLWVGSRFYSPMSFLRECAELGVSKRIATIPRGFKVGETWVLLAHAEAVLPWHESQPAQEDDKVLKPVPGIFQVFRPTAVEMIITETQNKDDELLNSLKNRGVTPVVVPDGDKDHQGSVYDKTEETA